MQLSIRTLEFIADTDGWGHMGGWGAGMAIFGFLFMASLIVLVVWLIASTARQNTSRDTASRAMAILDEAYARGDIDRDAYLLRRSDLER